MFVRLGENLINLANVTHMERMLYDHRTCVRINFIGDNYMRIYSDDTGVYEELVAWMKKHPQVDRSMK